MYCIFAYLMFFDCESKVCFKDSPANNGTAVVGVMNPIYSISDSIICFYSSLGLMMQEWWK